MNKRLIDLRGKKFGYLQVISYSQKYKKWKCLCRCGNAARIFPNNLKSGDTKSCGCLNSFLSKKRNTRHKMCHTPEYNSWASAKGRCFNKNNPKYALYGARGISMCDEWRFSFKKFYEHVGNRPSKKYSIDRINNNKGYEPGNVRWATARQQAMNRRNNVPKII